MTRDKVTAATIKAERLLKELQRNRAKGVLTDAEYRRAVETAVALESQKRAPRPASGLLPVLPVPVVPGEPESGDLAQEDEQPSPAG